jgi:hypothetical protein
MKNVEASLPWKDWESIQDWDTPSDDRHRTIFRDDAGKFHLVEEWMTVDGGCVSSPWSYFAERGKPVDESRCGKIFREIPITMRQAAKMWVEDWAPEELKPFITCK